LFWKRQGKTWPVDPARVAFGSVVASGKNLSRSHVRVRYAGASRPQELPFEQFVKRTNAALLEGKSPRIDDLLVAPMLKRHYAVFFDRLTDWGPAARRALDPAPRRRSRMLDAS